LISSNVMGGKYALWGGIATKTPVKPLFLTEIRGIFSLYLIFVN
jgi:hypothetical protein